MSALPKIMLVAAFSGAFAGCTQQEAQSRVAVRDSAPAAASQPQAAAPVQPPKANQQMLSLAQLPDSARSALNIAIPNFVVWDTAAIPDSLRARVPSNTNEGFIVLHGDVDGHGADDYILAGHNNKFLLIVALLANGDGRFRVVKVSEGASMGDGVHSPVVMALDQSQDREANDPPYDIRVEFLARPVPEIYRWFGEDKQFLIVNQGD